MREIIYNITQKATGRRISLTDLTEEFTKDNLLGIINKTQGEVLYTPLQLGNIQSFQYQNGSILITLSTSVPRINAGDELFVKLYSESEVAKESTLNEVSNKLDNLNVDVDLSSVAQQGDNTEATNSKILEEVLNVGDSLIDTYDEMIAIQLRAIIGEEEE